MEIQTDFVSRLVLTIIIYVILYNCLIAVLGAIGHIFKLLFVFLEYLRKKVFSD